MRNAVMNAKAEQEFPDLTEAVAHELNNIFNNVVLQLEVVKRTNLSEDLAAKVSNAQQKCRQGAALLKKLQRFADGRRDSAPETVDLNQLVQDLVAPRTAGKTTDQPPASQVELELAENLPSPVIVKADLSRLISLLLDQAVAADPATRNVRVRTERVKNGCRLIVEDQGPQVTSDQLNKLLEPFAVARSGGDDWSLAVCKVLARRLHGSLRLHSPPTGGLFVALELDAHEGAQH
jgi:signal transduction histidine kinase